MDFEIDAVDLAKLAASLAIDEEHDEVRRTLTRWFHARGYDVGWEWPTFRRSSRSAMSGRIDLRARRGRHVILVEIDRRAPREKSVYKLTHTPSSIAVVLIRPAKSRPFVRVVAGAGALSETPTPAPSPAADC